MMALMYKTLYAQLSKVATVVSFREANEIKNFPLIELGQIIDSPDNTKDYKRSKQNITIHIWTQGTSMTECLDLISAVEETVGGFDMELVKHLNSTLLVEEEENNSGNRVFHGVVIFEITHSK